MEQKIKLKNEIERQKKLIEDCEAAMEHVPTHLKPYQEMALKLHKDKLASLNNYLEFTPIKNGLEEVL